MTYIVTDQNNLLGVERNVDRTIVKGIVYEDEFLYLVRYLKYNFLTLLGGEVEDCEDFQKAFLREVLEESGITCKIEAELPKILEIRSDMKFQQLSGVYIAKYLSQGRAKLEHKEQFDGVVLEKIHIRDVMTKLIEQDCLTEQQKFLNSRDVIILSEFFAYFRAKQLGLYCFIE